MAVTRSDSDRAALRRRLEVLGLPVVALRRAGFLNPSRSDPDWTRAPQAVGVGPDQRVVAVWNHRHDARRRLVTIHDGGRYPVGSVVLTGCLEPSFVQPLPDGRILLVAARNRGGANAEVWSADGRQEHVGDLGDAIEGVLTTATGEIWVGYFDEAMGGSGPQGHGLARFSSDLQPVWLYPGPPTAPEIFDCYALNVAGETAWTCAYTQFHVVSACGDQVTDFGRAPYRSAHLLLVDGGAGALIGGLGPEYDLVTSFRITEGQAVASGSPQRLVLPDGMELRGFRSACRGPNLHVIIRGAWYRTDLDQLADEAE